MVIQAFGIEGLPLIHRGDDLAALICERFRFEDGDILCVAQTVYSKSRGYTRDLSAIVPGEYAERLARRDNEDPRFVQAVLDEAKEILIDDPFILTELPFGHIGVRSGVDRSNIEDGQVALLPPDPCAAAKELREGIRKCSGCDVRVIITDTVGRAFRRGQTGNAIGWSGMTAIKDFRGARDLFGHELKITEEAVVDEIAGFANFMMGEGSEGIPAIVFRGCGYWEGHDNLYFRKEEDLIRRALCRRG
ncbi:MAG: coenzyme F420-0:L-glutamate ligase [Methanomicrobiales archaeon]|nr:coenzyme F420-0:L-glutamate ligase [Methanomicrobiales archaeon]